MERKDEKLQHDKLNCLLRLSTASSSDPGETVATATTEPGVEGKPVMSTRAS
jgi:hypothetical protein